MEIMKISSITIILIIFFILSYIITQYNKIKSLQNKVKQSRSGVDVALTKRFDLIPNLVECVKAYCAHEEKILKEVTKARSDYMSQKRLEYAEIANSKTNDILLLAEKYPSLKANEQFIDLQMSLERTENSLSAARRLYNGDVNMYNTEIQTFPGNIFAKFMGAKPEHFFETEEHIKRNTKVNF